MSGFDEETWAGFDDTQPPDDMPEPTPNPARVVELPANLPEEFWDARPIHKRIRQAAWATADSADAVFLAILCRMSGMVHHDLKLQLAPKVGSLNLFGGLVSGSGVGKSSAMSCAQSLVIPPTYLTDDFKDGVGLGTGEGMAEIFMGMIEVETGETHKRATKYANAGDPIMKPGRAQVRHNAFFYLDEGQTLTKMMKERSGTTIGATIRTAWIGGALGQSNAREETTRFVKGGTYSMGLLVGFQPDTVQELLADGGPGTPQRFLWLSAYDPLLPDFVYGDDEEIIEPEPFRLPLCDGHGVPVTGTVRGPVWLRNQLHRELAARKRGEVVVDELDAHVSLMRCKLAALLAILDGRTRVNDEDWDLGGMVWNTSCMVRDFMIKHGRVKAAEERERYVAGVVEVAERTHLAAVGASGLVMRLARKIAEKTCADGAYTRGNAKRDQASKYRHAVPLAIDHAIEQGWILAEDDKILTPGRIRP